MKTVAVKVLNKELQINCPTDSESELQAAAQYLDAKMREIHQVGRIIDAERVATMAALNITHELLALRQQKGTELHAITDGIQRLQNKIDRALMKERMDS